MPEWIQAVDSAILLFIQDVLRADVLNPLVIWFTHLGDAGLLWIVCCALLLCFRPTRRAGLLALFAMLLGLLCNNVLLKQLVGRPRPYLVVADLQALIAPPDPNSFPSGHACASFAAAVSWLLSLPRSKRWLGIAGAVTAVLMAFSRLYVGVHFPTDVLTGALVGSLCALAVYTLARRIAPPKPGAYR